MDEDGVTELEVAIAGTGALLVQAEKYRLAAATADALRRAALTLGDEARRLHRHRALDAAAARPLMARARDLEERLRGLVTGIQAGPAYQAALAARAAGDAGALARLLPAIFAGLAPVEAAPELYAPVAWRRRGRAQPVDAIVAEVVRLGTEGLAAEGDDLSPGADALLPAVVLRDQPPADEPLVLRLPAGAVPAPLHRLIETGEYLVHRTPVHAAFAVVLSPAPDDEADTTALDHEGVARGLRAAGITVEMRALPGGA